MMNENFSGYVLAGGKSSRMKTDKAFLKIDDETFLERAVNTLKEVCEERVKVVLNQTQTHFIEKLPQNVRAIFDVYENRGAPGGIHAALKDCPTRYAIILAVDLPFVTGQIITKLTELAQSSNKFLATVPRLEDGEIQPLCAVYHARYCSRTLEQLLNENESASVRDLVNLISTRYVDENKLPDDESKKAFFNINYPAEFESLQ